MNVLMGLNAPWVGGTRIHVLTLAQALLGRGHRVILVTDPGLLTGEMAQRGIPFVPRVDGLEPMLEMLLGLVDQLQPDVLHAHPAASILESYLLSRITGIPFVVTMHGEYLMHFAQTRLGERLGEAVHTVVAVSDRVREYLLARSALAPEKVRVVPNGIDTDEFRPGRDVSVLRAALGLAPGEQVVMYLGRLDSDKRAAILGTAEAVRLLAGRGLPVTGVFVGIGDLYPALEQVRLQAGSATGREALRLLGFRRDLPQLLSLADVVVATGRAALEALAVGKPVVAAGRVGYLGLVTPDNWDRARATNFGDHGTLPKPDHTELADLLYHVLAYRVTPDDLGLHLRQLVIEHYDIQRVTGELEAIYRSASRSRGGAGTPPPLGKLGG
ncbi:MAG: glycosyltransferase family 4 protein [Betaproteobacteria bacterium]